MLLYAETGPMSVSVYPHNPTRVTNIYAAASVAWCSVPVSRSISRLDSSPTLDKGEWRRLERLRAHLRRLVGRGAPGRGSLCRPPKLAQLSSRTGLSGRSRSASRPRLLATKILVHPDMVGDKTAEKDFAVCFAAGNKTLELLRSVRDELQGTLYQKIRFGK